MFRKLLPAFGFLFLPIVSQAALTNYWSFNDSNLDPNFGVATLAANWEGAGIEVETFDLTGTSWNARLGYPAGHALTYIDLVTGFSQHELVLSGLDFAGQAGVSVSYATRSNGFFDLHETATISYKIGSGEWSEAVDIPLPTGDWEVREFSFGSDLDGESNVSIRISHDAVFEAGEFLRFDNLVVAVVPEPAATAVACAAGLVVLAICRAGRRSKTRTVVGR